MKFAYRNREFWCKGYYVDTVGKNTAAIKEYIANQLKVDKETDQLSIFDPNDPLTGSKQQTHDWQVNKKAHLCSLVDKGYARKSKAIRYAGGYLLSISIFNGTCASKRTGSDMAGNA